MGAWYCLLVIMLVIGLRWRQDGAQSSVLSVESASVLNGASILFVFVQHIHAFLLGPLNYEYKGLLDKCYIPLSDMICQQHVVMFLFFSGYGVMEQLLKRGDAYLDGFGKKRIFRVWANFAIAVAVYAVGNLVLRTDVSFRQMLVSLTCWQQIGNPSWYIFCILCCYAAFGASALAFRRIKLPYRGLWLPVAFLCVVYVLVLHHFIPQKTWWYNTVAAFVFGVFFSSYRDRILLLLKRYYWAFSPAVCIAFYVAYTRFVSFKDFGIKNNLLSVCFIMVVLTFTMKVKIVSPVLSWCGKHVFPLYMYHGLFFLIVRSLYSGSLTPLAAHALIAAVLVMTLLTAKYYHYWEVR